MTSTARARARAPRPGSSPGRAAARAARAAAGQSPAVVPQEQLLERRRAADQRRHARAARAARASPAARPARPARRRARRPAVSASIVIRVRWRSSASEPVSTVRPERMIVTRSHSASTSDRMWLESSTVRPRARSSATHVAEDLLHQRVQARGRLVEDQQLDVGRQRRDQRDLLAVALGVRAALLGRVELEALEQLGAALLVEAAAQPPEQVDRLAAAQVRPQRDVAGHVGEPAVQRGRVAPRVAAQQPRRARRRRAAARAAPGSSSTCRRRSGPRKPCTSPSATSRSSPSSARVAPKVLTRPEIEIGGSRFT